MVLRLVADIFAFIRVSVFLPKHVQKQSVIKLIYKDKMYKILINAQNLTQPILCPQRILSQISVQVNSQLGIAASGENQSLIVCETEGEVYLYKKSKKQENTKEETQHQVELDSLQIKTQVLYLRNVTQSAYVSILKNLEQRKEHIDLVQILKEAPPNPNLQMLIYFKSTLISEELQSVFLYDHNLYVLYIQEVIIVKKEKHPQLDKELLYLVNDFKYQQGKEEQQMETLCKQIYIQLPTCLLCLIKLEYQISGLPKKIATNKAVLSSQSTCQTCNIVQHPSKNLSCYHCASQEDMWACLVCSLVGCGRYKNADAFKHFHKSGHILTINLETQRIWNYQSDSFCHRLVPLYKQESTLKFPDYSGKKTPKLHQQTMESAFWEYCSLVSEQLERQRVFYQKEQMKEEERFEKESTNIEKKLMQVEKEIDMKSQQVKKLAKKNKKLTKRLVEVREKCSEDRQLLNSYDRLLKEDSHEDSMAEIEATSPKIQEKLKILATLEEEIQHTLLKLTQ